MSAIDLNTTLDQGLCDPYHKVSDKTPVQSRAVTHERWFCNPLLHCSPQIRIGLSDACRERKSPAAYRK